MTSVASGSVWYIYGIVADDAGPATSAPSGLDDADVTLERVGRLAALVSVLEAEQYATERLDANVADVEWLGPRAIAHDRVLTWASERGHGAVVPLPMFSVFSGPTAVQAMLRERADELTAALEHVRAGREYALRVYRVDAELLAALGGLSNRIRALEETAAAASPGQRYLLERKLEAEKRIEMRVVTQQIVDEIIASLQPVAVGVIRSPIPRIAAADAPAAGIMVLSAAFLVPHDRVAEFQRALTALVDRHGREGRGFRFDFTGPWPPYHFARGDTGDR